MRTRTLVTAGLAAALSVAAFAAALDAYLVKYVPKVGDTDKYSIKIEMDFGGQPATYTGAVTDKVTKVNPDGSYEVEQTQSDATISMGGNEFPAGAGNTSTVVAKPNGMVSELRGAETSGDSYRMSVLSVFLQPSKPVEVGDTWTEDIKADSQKGIVAAKAEYKVLAEEKVGATDTLKVQTSLKETVGAEPASSAGTIWLDRATWEVVKYEGKLTNAPIPGAPAPVNATLTLTRAG